MTNAIRNSAIDSVSGHSPTEATGDTAVYGIVRDLTGQKATADQLLQLQSNLALALKFMPHGIIFYDADERLVFVNDLFADVFGVGRDVARPGMRFWDVLLATITARELDADPLDLARQFYDRHKADALVGELSRQLIEYAPQKFIAVDTHMMPDGSWVSLFKDLSEQMRMEAALKASEQSYRDVFDNSSDQIFVLEVTADQRFRFERLNPAAERAVSLSSDAIHGKYIEEVIPPYDLDAQIMRCRSCLSAGTRIRFEESLRTPGGDRYFETSLIPVRGSVGTVGRIIRIARDITEERQISRLRGERESYFRTLVENSPDAIVRYDRNCRRIYSNLAHAKISGISAEDGNGKTPMELGVFGPGLAEAFQARIEQVIATGATQEINIDFDRNGARIHYWVRAVPEMDLDGTIVSVLTMARNMTDRVNAETQLKQREQEYRTLVENSPDFIARYGGDRRCLYMNQAMRKQLARVLDPFGRTPADFGIIADPVAFDANIRAVFDTGTLQEAETAYIAIDGRRQWGHIRFAPEFDDLGAVKSVLAVSHNITELVESRNKINHLAFYDTLTDLPNRTFMHDYVRGLMAGSEGAAASFGFMMLDVDRFKEVNDTLGHAAGDALLQEVARRLRRVVHARDIIARLGGDEFAIVLPATSSKERLAHIAAGLLRELATPIHLSSREISVSASIGIARFPADSDDFLEILKNSDAAMYKVKGTGRNGYQFYDAEMMARATERMMIEATLRKALVRHELELYFQPQVALRSGRIIGAEALLRWNHPEFGLLAPDRFIPIAEETGLIVDIGRWVIERTCQAAAAWNGGRAEPFVVSANISPRQFGHNDLVSTVEDALKDAGCDPEWLCLEMTESLLLEDKQNVKSTLESLKEIGVSIAIDDFGTGYSALSYLSNFPIDVLKIDRSFIRDIGIDRRKTELTRAIIGIANALDMKLVAEGVETPLQGDVLEANGCIVAQGYLYGKPMPERMLTRLLPPAAFEIGLPPPAAVEIGLPPNAAETGRRLA